MSCVVRRLSHFLGWAEGPSCETEAFPERTLVMSKKITTTTPPTDYNKEQGWHTNTDLGCDVKTILRSDRKMKVGKEYQGVLRRDSEGSRSCPKVLTSTWSDLRSESITNFVWHSVA